MRARSLWIPGGCLFLSLLLMSGSTLFAEEEEKGGAEHGWLGIVVRGLEEGEARELHYDRDYGVMIQKVIPGGPAAVAGLREGDILFRVGKIRCEGVPSLREALADTRPGDGIEVAAWREGKAFEREIRLGERPEEFAEGPEGEEHPEGRLEELEAERREVREARERQEERIKDLTEALIGAAKEGQPDRARKLAAELRESAFHAGVLAARGEALEEEMEEVRGATGRRGGEREHAEREERRGGDEREAAERRIEVMRLAMKVLAEEGKKNAVDQVERKIHAIEVALKGRRDREAVEIRESAPKNGQMAELLRYAGKLYRERKMPDRAEMCEKLGEDYLERDRAGRRREKEGGGMEERMARLEDRVAQLRKALEAIEREIRSLRR